MTSNAIIRVAALAALVALAACGDPGRPDPPVRVTGSYVLRSVDGLPLPVALRSSVDAEEVLESGTLTVDEDGRVTRTLVFRWGPVGGPYTQPAGHEGAAFVVDGVGAVLTFSRIGGAAPYSDTVAVAGRRLRVRTLIDRAAVPRHELVWER